LRFCSVKVTVVDVSVTKPPREGAREAAKITLIGLDVTLEVLPVLPRVLREVMIVDTLTGPVTPTGLATSTTDACTPAKTSAGSSGTDAETRLASTDLVDMRNVLWIASTGTWPG